MAPKPIPPIPLEFVKGALKRHTSGHVSAFYCMKKPSDLSSVYQPSELPKVRLEVTRVRNDYILSVMLKIQHKNILRLEAIKDKAADDDNLIGVFVEPYDGHLIAYLEHLVADNITGVIPSEAFRDLVSQIIDGIEELRINGVYHGAISIENVYYVIAGHVPIVKLANFQQLIDTSLEIAQLGDWVGLGNLLSYISNAARLLNNNVSCAMIDHLAAKLQGLTDTALLPILKKEILQDPFFWSKRRRAGFYIHDIAEVVNDADFVQSVNDYMNWSLPWNTNPHDGLIAAMDEYRRTELNMDPYNGMDPVENIKCMSGAYTHQDKLKGKLMYSSVLLSVDAAIQRNQPDLCLTLHMLLNGEMAAEAEAAAAAAAAEEAPAVDADMNEAAAAAAEEAPAVGADMNE